MRRNLFAIKKNTHAKLNLRIGKMKMSKRCLECNKKLENDFEIIWHECDQDLQE